MDDTNDRDDLIGFIEAVSGDEHLKIEENLGDGFVRLRTAEAERRQAKHDIRCVEDAVIEMLRNSRDAGATKIFLAASKDENQIRYLTCIDNGCGIPRHMQSLVFEPRVTSKLDSMVVDNWGVHGRGMALFSIHENMRNASVLASDVNLGTSIHTEADLTVLPEKTDQSTFPQIVKEADGTQRIARGPHNIIRCVLEFAFDDEDVDVYMGSPAEIANTLFFLGHRSLSDSDLLFCDDLNTLPVWLRPAACGDATELAAMCDAIGLPLSERTAHRIIAETMSPLAPLINRITGKSAKKPDVDIYRDHRNLKISEDDIDDFSRTLEKVFSKLGQKYYLTLSEVPRVTVTRDCIRVRFDIEKE